MTAEEVLRAAQVIPQWFPRLRNEPFQVKSCRTVKYNCIAYAMGDEENVCWPGVKYLPGRVPKDDSLPAFIGAFANLGYECCNEGGVEPGFEKVVLCWGKGSTHSLVRFSIDYERENLHVSPLPRTMRVEYPGAIYHVMSRGDRREDIFLDEVDRQDFLKTLAEACQKTGFQVHAYCLMRNHFHLVAETPNGNLVAGMAWLLSAYSIRLNHRHKLSGHVFGGRYKALIVEGRGGYLKTACDYVHLNPVRAGLLRLEDRLAAYPWSSLVW